MTSIDIKLKSRVTVHNNFNTSNVMRVDASHSEPDSVTA